MARYLIIESRCSFAVDQADFCRDLARRLAADNRVTLFLVQNGVMPARAGAHGPGFADLARIGVEILADDFSLRERGISSDRLQPGVTPSTLEFVIDRLADGAKAFWH